MAPDVELLWRGETLSQPAPVESPVTPIGATQIGSLPAPKTAHSSAEVLEIITGKAFDAPLCMTCGIKISSSRLLLRVRGLRFDQWLLLREE